MLEINYMSIKNIDWKNFIMAGTGYIYFYLRVELSYKYSWNEDRESEEQDQLIQLWDWWSIRRHDHSHCYIYPSICAQDCLRSVLHSKLSKKKKYSRKLSFLFRDRERANNFLFGKIASSLFFLCKWIETIHISV